MKKILSLFALITFNIGLMSVSHSVGLVEEEDGRASDCARMARTVVLITAAELGEDPNGENFYGYLELYNNLFNACYNS